jgi:energy-coupling factor transport system ATP-binding protein
MLAAANPGERALEAWFHSSKTRKNELDLVQRADELLAQVGLGCRGDSSGDGISRGQAKRVAIARCLFGDQRVLFLDEPLSGLDRHGIEDVTQLLRDLAARRDSAMVIVEHITHLPALLDFATTVWKLENGSLFAAAPQQVRQELSTYKVDVHDWAKAWAGSCGERKFLPGGASLTVYSRCDADRNCLLDVRGLSVCRGAMAVLSDFNLRLCAGDLAILEAPNGWGKTTLAEAVAGLIPAKCGSVKTGGNELAHLPAWERRKKGLHFLPSRNQTFDSLTVAESFRVIETLVPDRWAQWQNRRVGTLSGGEKQKLALATFYSSNCSVRLLDEPFAALDTSGLNELRNNLFPNHENANLIMLPGWPEGDGA